MNKKAFGRFSGELVEEIKFIDLDKVLRYNTFTTFPQGALTQSKRLLKEAKELLANRPPQDSLGRRGAGSTTSVTSSPGQNNCNVVYGYEGSDYITLSNNNNDTDTH